jgi:hypothetical protein
MVWRGLEVGLMRGIYVGFGHGLIIFDFYLLASRFGKYRKICYIYSVSTTIILLDTFSCYYLFTHT